MYVRPIRQLKFIKHVGPEITHIWQNTSKDGVPRKDVPFRGLETKI